MSKKIEIYIACHKESELPKNDIFVPIHVGAKIAKKTLGSMQRDDEGDNISEKNPQYCEMTAQYWAWKHSTADYIGLCHYRRYLNFTNKTFTNYTPDNRKQVFIPVLCPQTEEKYGLLDKAQIKDIVLQNDIIVAKAQDLSKVNTPFGPQKTVLQHWIAHDQALISVKDLKKMFDIVKRGYPYIYKYMQSYLNGKYFYGFNTFVLRADLFRSMCEFEFDVLEKLEKEVDLSQYNQQLSRIYGFMGEILFSSYIYYLKKTQQTIRLKECQMLYFDQTDPYTDIIPNTTESYKIVIDSEDVPIFLIDPLVTTLLKNISKDKQYELIVLMKTKNTFYEGYYSRIIERYNNVCIFFKETRSFVGLLRELYGDFKYYPGSFLPWILPNIDKCLYLKWNTLINCNIDFYFNINLQDKIVAAVKSVYYQGILNTFYQDDKKYNENKMKIDNIFDFVSDTVFFINLTDARSIGLDKVVEKLPIESYDLPRAPRSIEVFNAIYQHKIKFLSHKYNWLYDTTQGTEFYIKEAPLSLLKEYKASQKDAYINSYQDDSPWYIYKNPEFYLRYWRIANDSELHEILHNHLIVRNSTPLSVKDFAWKFIDAIFPKKTSRRELIKRLFPKKGRVYSYLRRYI